MLYRFPKQMGQKSQPFSSVVRRGAGRSCLFCDNPEISGKEDERDGPAYFRVKREASLSVVVRFWTHATVIPQTPRLPRPLSLPL
jgi:hypothetical protein